MSANAKRPIVPMALPGAIPASIDGRSRPRFLDVDPQRLVVDETYQRNLSERSVRLIRKIVEEWDWQRFKPPVVVEIEDGFHVIDGQHTAIAAITHAGIGVIPVMVVETGDVASRARAFVGHNRDRISITAPQIFYAELAAGDEEAVTMKQVCDRAGVTILKYPPFNGVYRVGDTMALATIRRTIAKNGALGARQVLQALVDANCAPIAVDFIRAGATLMFAPEYRGSLKIEDFSSIVRGMEGRISVEVEQLAAAKKLPLWRALVIIIANRRPRRGYSSAA